MMHKTNLIVCLIISFISITWLISSSMASQQRLINFQGRLTDQQGNPLDGTYDVIFSIYSSSTNTEPLWTEEHTNVSVSKGLVNVLLGSITSFEIPNKITFDKSRYLGITIDCDHNPHTEEPEMLPRQQILPAIYAYNADRLDGKDSSEYTTPQTDAGRPGVIENLYEGNTKLINKYLGKEDIAVNADKIDGYHAIPSSGANNAIPVINSGITYSNLRAGYASSAGNASSCGNSDKLDGYHASHFAAAGHTHSLYRQRDCYRITYNTTGNVMCGTGYYAAGIWDDGFGMPGCNGLVCCR